MLRSDPMMQVRILSTINRELLKPSASVALHRHSNALVDVLPPEADSSISLLDASERPDVSYSVRLSSWHPLALVSTNTSALQTTTLGKSGCIIA